MYIRRSEWNQTAVNKIIHKTAPIKVTAIQLPQLARSLTHDHALYLLLLHYTMSLDLHTCVCVCVYMYDPHCGVHAICAATNHWRKSLSEEKIFLTTQAREGERKGGNPRTAGLARLTKNKNKNTQKLLFIQANLNKFLFQTIQSFIIVLPNCAKLKKKLFFTCKNSDWTDISFQIDTEWEKNQENENPTLIKLSRSGFWWLSVFSTNRGSSSNNNNNKMQCIRFVQTYYKTGTKN